MKVLCVAEKPSIAKTIAGILGDQYSTREGKSKYNKNFDLSFDFGPGLGHADVTLTSVLGHLTSTDIASEYSDWQAQPPVVCFEARVTTEVPVKMKQVSDNISREARHARTLIIWTDCDREGEYIGWEVWQSARMSNPGIIVKRATFSNLERAHIVRAARNLVDLDMRQVNAVAARQEIDLRTGAAFTRLQTLKLRPVHQDLKGKTISYGSCQYPTLGFVVDRWRKVMSHRPEPFWAIHAACRQDRIDVNLTWRRTNLFDRFAAIALFQQVLDRGKFKVVDVTERPRSRWRPLPLTTVELQKQGTRYLRMSSTTVMSHAEALYQRGFLSYPRTETDRFDRGMDLRALVAKQTTDSSWGVYAQGLLEAVPPRTSPGFRQPRAGLHDDKAHPPIHPIGHITRAACLSADEHRVYEFVTRRFLACCSDDARGHQVDVELACAGERFAAHGLTVLERNYLDVYPYDRWESSDAQLPAFVRGASVDMVRCELTEGKTSRPHFITEPELIGAMDANGIGTDATMASHIDTIQAREYVVKTRSSGGGGSGGVAQFVPTQLGIALVEGFEAIGFDESLTKPHLRKATEHQLALIHAGRAAKHDVVADLVGQYRAAYLRTERHIQKLKDAVLKEFS